MQSIDKIPKKIHYCWIGGSEKPDQVKKCIDSWRKFAPDYEIVEWNESNFPLEKCNRYVNGAIDKKKWAFVSDYMRLSILYSEGGIYLDTDIELVKNIDIFLDNSSFLCRESLNTVCTALIGAKPKQKWIKDLMDLYDKREFVNSDGNIDLTPNSKYIYCFLKDRYNLIENNDLNELKCKLIVYPAEYFSPKNYSTMKMKITENTYAIHHYGGLWKSPMVKVKDYILALITRIIGEKRRIRLKEIIYK